jgi:Domain of unknown function (DUF6265)
MPNSNILLACLLASLVFTAFRQSQSVSVNRFSWLSGCWEGRAGEAVVEEIWSKPAGMSLIGLSRTVKNGRTQSFEFMQIREDKGTLVYLAQPQGRPAVAFTFNPKAATQASSTTFENPTHDFPQRIIYEQKGNMLVASIEGMLKGKLERQEFLLRRVRCNE